MAEQEKKIYRTKKTAGKTVEVPTMIANPSTPKYQTAITVVEGKTAHIVPIQQAVKIEYRDGRFFAGSVDLEEIDLANVRDPEVTNLDLPTLRVIYSTILENLADSFMHGRLDSNNVIFHSVTLRVPELMQRLGMKGNADRQHTMALINKIRSYQNMIGVMYKQLGNNRTFENKYAMLVWISQEEEKNTITFAAPYLNRLAYDIMDDSIRRDRHGEIERKKDGRPKLQVSHSYLMKSTIASERNKNAVEIVRIVCDLIEQTGSRGGIPNISAKTILSRHPQLQQSLNNTGDSSNKNRLLKRTFTKAWELLHTQTILEERYKNIRFPTPTSYPTMSTLDMIFEFPHDGKIRKAGQEQD